MEIANWNNGELKHCQYLYIIKKNIEDKDLIKNCLYLCDIINSLKNIKMKKLYYFLFIATLLFGSAFAFTSCGDDDTDEEIEAADNNSKIIGTWQCVRSECLGLVYDYEEENDIEYLVFKKSGDFYDVDIDDYDGGVTVTKGKWSQTSKGFSIRYTNSTDKDIMSVAGSMAFDMEIIELTSSKFVCNWSLIGGRNEMKKVSDNVAEKYIKNASL